MKLIAIAALLLAFTPLRSLANTAPITVITKMKGGPVDGCIKTVGGVVSAVSCQSGPTGATGATGGTGSNGTNGTNGTNGATGATGGTGATGSTGGTGLTGATGATGGTGSNGSTGAAGATGATGADGVVSVASSNGFGGSITSHVLTITESITGLLKGNATAISAATSGTDYTGGTVSGPIGISSNTSTITSQTGTGTKFVVDTNPTIASASVTGTLTTATQTQTGPYSNTQAGTASTPSIFSSGSPFQGTGTTSRPLWLIEDAASPSSTWGTAGTYIGVNAISTATGTLLELDKAGTTEFSVSAAGTGTFRGTMSSAQVTVGGVGVISSGNNIPLALGSVRTFSTANLNQVFMASSTASASSGVSVAVNINPTINQSSTAGYTALSINAIETANGSGNKRLIEANAGAAGTTNEFFVTNGGNISANGTTLTMANIASATPGTAACWTAGGVLGTDVANCIASLREYKQNFEEMDPVEALNTVIVLADAARYYRYTDEFLGPSKDKPHARDMQPGFIAEEVEAIDPRYAAYNGAKLRGVRYEQMAATEAVAIKELKKEIDDLKTEVILLRAGIR